LLKALLQAKEETEKMGRTEVMVAKVGMVGMEGTVPMKYGRGPLLVGLLVGLLEAVVEEAVEGTVEMVEVEGMVAVEELVEPYGLAL
jgi:hypothetical protein